MKKIVTTKYFGPTNHRGARIRVKVGQKTFCWLGWDHRVDCDENHRIAGAYGLGAFPNNIDGGILKEGELVWWVK